MARAERKALTLPVQDLSRVIDIAVQKAAGVPRLRPGILVGRWVEGELANPGAIAAKVTRELAPQFKGVKLSPIAIPGKGGTTIGFIAPEILER